tara:strand:- start:59293 stop:59973 length:681 start_codon:yes stop_codon:yes gene_type:complete
LTKNKALIISTVKASGEKHMDLDLQFLNKTILDKEILLTLRFYIWEDYWLSIGYHQKNLPAHWIDLEKEELIKIVRRPSGGGAVLHSGGITYALTFKKPLYKKLSYEKINNWLIKSFSEIGLELKPGETKRSIILENCFSSSFSSDLIDKNGYKRIGSAQYWKQGSFLQHGEIQLNPPSDLWTKIFKQSAPPKIKLNLTHSELITFLKNSFLKLYPDLYVKKIDLI